MVGGLGEEMFLPTEPYLRCVYERVALAYVALPLTHVYIYIYIYVYIYIYIYI